MQTDENCIRFKMPMTQKKNKSRLIHGNGRPIFHAPCVEGLTVCLWLSSSSSVICQTTGPKPLPKRFLHIVRSRVSSFNSQYPLLSLRSSSSFLHLLPRLLVTSICPFIFPSITCFRRQFLRKMWPIQLAFRFLISYRRKDYVNEKFQRHHQESNLSPSGL